MSEPVSEPGPRTQAERRRSRWPGWIWAIPLAALLVVGWLGFRALATGGETIVVVFDDAARAKPGETEVFYRGVKIGQLKRVRFTAGGRAVEMTLHMSKQAGPFLRQGAHFWLVGANPSLSNPRSLASVLSGPTIGMTPGTGAPARRFAGSETPPAAKTGPEGPRIAYRTVFGGDAGALSVGAPVKLRGFTVGEVTAVKLAYDPRTGDLSAPVALALDPGRIGIPTAGRGAMDAALARWISRGMRATLSQDPPFVGARQVSLAFLPGQRQAVLGGSADDRLIPSAAASGDMTELTGKADRILTKIDAVPIDQIGANVRDASAHIRQLTGSPKLAASIDHLDSTLADVDRTVHQVSPQVGPLVEQLRRTADAAEQTASAADRIAGGSPTSQNSDLPTALHELTDAARSIRSLADYLDRHPEALIKGRKADQP